MWKGINSEKGKLVSDAEAYEYAKEHLDQMPERDKLLFVEFFFSGDWIKEESNNVETV